MAQQIFTQRPKNSQEFLKQLEELTKLNRQSQLKTGFDTSSNVPYVLPGSQRINTGLAGTRQELKMPTVPVFETMQDYPASRVSDKGEKPQCISKTG